MTLGVGIALTVISEHVPVQRVAAYERLGRPNVVWSRGHRVDVCGAQLGDRRVHHVPDTETGVRDRVPESQEAQPGSQVEQIQDAIGRSGHILSESPTISVSSVVTISIACSPAAADSPPSSARQRSGRLPRVFRHPPRPEQISSSCILVSIRTDFCSNASNERPSPSALASSLRCSPV